MLARLSGHDHQHAQRGDFGLADGVASVEVVAAFLEQREDGLCLVPQCHRLRVVAGEPGEAFDRI